MASKLKPKDPNPSYKPDPSVTQRRLEDLQRVFGMYTFPFPSLRILIICMLRASLRGPWQKQHLLSISVRG